MVGRGAFVERLRGAIGLPPALRGRADHSAALSWRRAYNATFDNPKTAKRAVRADLAGRLRRDPELRAHLERSFKPGMSWSNYGQWHVDHIHPVCKFDLSRPEHRAAVNALDNLQPLWAAENLSKSSK